VPHEIFKHYKELEEVGLAAPQVTYIMKDLKEHGYDVSTNATTISEAKEEIENYFTMLAKAKYRGR
jgi:energy-coupling factor transport system ATP-binding protein